MLFATKDLVVSLHQFFGSFLVGFYGTHSTWRVDTCIQFPCNSTPVPS